MQLLTSPNFSEADIEAIQKGYRAKEDVYVQTLQRELDLTPNHLIEDRLSSLAWLISEGLLEIQIAIRVDEYGNVRPGMFHEKLGIFYDSKDNFVVFTGSANETQSAFEENFEMVDVFTSWEHDGKRAEIKKNHFSELWSRKTFGLAIIPFPEAVKQRLLEFRSPEPPSKNYRNWPVASIKLKNDPFEGFWPHQKSAILAWEDNRRRGILSMATGSGKTRTALQAALRCKNLSLIVISVPYNVLIDQWSSELNKSGFSGAQIIRTAESTEDWRKSLFQRLYSVRDKRSDAPPLIVIGTVKSLSGSVFSGILEDAGRPADSLLIVDEVHHSGAPTFQTSLHSFFSYRLGLSATPARYFDEEGTDFLLNYFDGIVYNYEMAHALHDGFLCPYEYHVYPAHLNDDEYEKYLALTQRIAQMLTHNIPNNEEILRRLYGRRADILKKCQSKLETLRMILEQHHLQKTIIYCSETTQLDEVSGILNEKKLRFLTYTSQISQANRREVMGDFASGFVPILAAINCLDEGVDIPDVREAIILASTSNNLQFIQRRGRILRKSPVKNRAVLIDILALPPENSDNEAKLMLRGELTRIKEMARLAENRHEALRQVRDYAARYGVFLTELLAE